MATNAITSSLPEKDLRVSDVASGRTLPRACRSADLLRRWRSRSQGERPLPRANALRLTEHVHVELHLTIRRSSSYLSMLPSAAPPAPVLIVKDTRHLVKSFARLAQRAAAHPPPLLPVAFTATPSRELLDALLEMAFDAVRLKAPT